MAPKDKPTSSSDQPKPKKPRTELDADKTKEAGEHTHEDLDDDDKDDFNELMGSAEDASEVRLLHLLPVFIGLYWVPLGTKPLVP